MAEAQDGVESSFAWDQALALSQVLAASNGERDVYRLQRIGVLQAGAWFYPQSDALGSVRQWTDPAGAVLGLQAYGPYGEALAPLGPPPASWRYTGEWQDGTGLVYLRARWYNGVLGQFTQVDPLGGMGSAYTYARNNPLAYVDPSGLDARSDPGSWWRDPSLPLWRAQFLRDVDYQTRRQAEQAYLHFSADPLYFVALYVGILQGDEAALQNPEYWALGILAEYTDLKTTPEALILAALRQWYGTGAAMEVECLAATPLSDAIQSARRSGRWVLLAGAVPAVGAVAGPDFLVSPGGDVIIVPAGATGPFATDSPGFQFVGGSGGHGLDARVTAVRVMDPTPPRGSSPGYPNGYVTYMNRTDRQGMDPYSGRPISRDDPWRHYPLSDPEEKR